MSAVHDLIAKRATRLLQLLEVVSALGYEVKALQVRGIAAIKQVVPRQ